MEVDSSLALFARSSAFLLLQQQSLNRSELNMKCDFEMKTFFALSPCLQRTRVSTNSSPLDLNIIANTIKRFGAEGNLMKFELELFFNCFSMHCRASDNWIIVVCLSELSSFNLISTALLCHRASDARPLRTNFYVRPTRIVCSRVNPSHCSAYLWSNKNILRETKLERKQTLIVHKTAVRLYGLDEKDSRHSCPT